MIRSLRSHLFCTGLLLSSLQLGLSQTLTNTFFFGPPTTPVWDVSGTYQITNFLQSSRIQPLTIVLNDIAMDADSHGHLSGGGPIFVLVGTDFVGGDYRLSGNITGGGSKTRVNFSLQFNGNGIVAGVVTTCSISGRYNLEVNSTATNVVMSGKSSGSAHFAHLGSGTFKADTSLPLPAGVDGGWTANLNMIPFNNRLIGTAVLLVDNNPVAALAAKANGNTPRNSSNAKVRLNGFGMSSGTQVTLQFTPQAGVSNIPATVAGHILGQKVEN